jgi:hypothetical protein
LPYLPFGREWLEALAMMTATDPKSGRRINLRLYRDIESFRTYHLRSVKDAQGRILA